MNNLFYFLRHLKQRRDAIDSKKDMNARIDLLINITTF